MLFSSSVAYADPELPISSGDKVRQHPVDKNGDGVVDKAEFMAAADKRFNKIDQDRDGLINRKEMKQARKLRRAKIRARMATMRRHRAE